MKKIKHATNLDLHKIADMTQGFSGAEVANLINEAAITAVNSNSVIVEIKHIEQAFESMKHLYNEFYDQQ